jgi:hypothetical protein
MLGDFINFESFLNPDKKNWDFDPESIFYNGSEPTVTVSPKAVAFDIETTFDNSLTPTVTVSSKAPLTSPCDICHRKVRQLFTLNQRGLTFFVCCYCYKERYKNCSKVTKSFVDPKTLEINPQPRVKWDDICTFGQQFTPILDKARKQNRKNKRV